MNGCIYARYSTDNQNHETIEVQVEKCSAYAREHNIEIVEVFADEAVSGMKSDRPELNRLFAAVKLHAFECVIIYDQSRFSRDIVDWFMFRRKMQNSNIKIISATQEWVGGDINNTAVFATEGINALVNQLHVLQTREKVVDAMNHIAERGLHTGGKPALGYDVDSNRHFVINEREANIIRLIFSMYADGQSYNKIIDTLNAKSYKTKFGKTFGKNSLSEILRNEKYIGTFVFNKIPQKHSGKRNSHAVNPNALRIENAVPPIVSEETWNKVQMRLKCHKRNAVNRAKVDYILSGKVFCGQCGRAMIGHTSKGIYHFYVCSGKRQTRTCDKKNIQKEFLENTVLKFVASTLSTEESRMSISKALFESEQKMQDTVSPAEKYIKAKIKETSAKIENINNAIAQGVWSASTAAMLKQLEKGQQDLYIELATIEKTRVVSKHTYKEIFETINKISKIEINTPESKHLLINFVKKVIVYNDRIRVILYPLADPTEKLQKKEVPLNETSSNGTFTNGAGGGTPSVSVQVVGLALIIEANLSF